MFYHIETCQHVKFEPFDIEAEQVDCRTTSLVDDIRKRSDDRRRTGWIGAEHAVPSNGKASGGAAGEIGEREFDFFSGILRTAERALEDRRLSKPACECSKFGYGFDQNSFPLPAGF